MTRVRERRSTGRTNLSQCHFVQSDWTGRKLGRS